MSWKFYFVTLENRSHSQIGKSLFLMLLQASTIWYEDILCIYLERYIAFWIPFIKLILCMHKSNKYFSMRYILREIKTGLGGNYFTQRQHLKIEFLHCENKNQFKTLVGTFTLNIPTCKLTYVKRKYTVVNVWNSCLDFLVLKHV